MKVVRLSHATNPTMDIPGRKHETLENKAGMETLLSPPDQPPIPYMMREDNIRIEPMFKYKGERRNAVTYAPIRVLLPSTCTYVIRIAKNYRPKGQKSRLLPRRPPDREK